MGGAWEGRNEQEGRAVGDRLPFVYGCWMVVSDTHGRSGQACLCNLGLCVSGLRMPEPQYCSLVIQVLSVWLLLSVIDWSYLGGFQYIPVSSLHLC